MWAFLFHLSKMSRMDFMHAYQSRKQKNKKLKIVFFSIIKFKQDNIMHLKIFSTMSYLQNHYNLIVTLARNEGFIQK